MKSQYFLVATELYESILIFPKLWLILFVIPLLLLIRYLIESKMLLDNPKSNNIKCSILPLADIIYSPI